MSNTMEQNETSISKQTSSCHDIKRRTIIAKTAEMRTKEANTSGSHGNKCFMARRIQKGNALLGGKHNYGK
jgi:hypothetical protein